MKPLVAGVVFALVGLVAWHVYATSDFAQRRSQERFKALSAEQKLAHWEDRIREAGGKEAYRELARTIRDYGMVKQHAEGHIFGKALYDVLGFDGVAVCDTSFAYSCFHAFMTQAIIQGGIENAQKLHLACRKALGSASDNCEHGIGHGIQSMLPYDVGGITKALAVCASLTPPSHPVAGCAGGVFMEYGTRDMGNEGARDYRPFSETEILEPCASLDKEWIPSCALWQTDWWLKTHPDKDDRSKTAKDMGAWCKAMPGGEVAYALCIEGITRRMKVLTGGDPSRTALICAHVTSDPHEHYRCHELSAMRFAYYYPLEKALLACDGLSESEISACREGTTTEDARLRSRGATYAQENDL